ncbi:phosphatidate cytidylyltransferase [Taylorella equigenitalis]|uniref:Phosphatidate cytidylyltransferase n=1 Tax=Taylorella equigenitalis (strain MCE9) TaxID=937774 RepID=A0A654KIX7_TAYEM|nr:CDP-archaeol synthase [Taylorella equigenitalis]ADU92319.1 Phosphatidate cytidylyltransferase [Taylorella equigenitalis MCE9]ASY40805.1 phosphatidate cytidylyltransferase [Taylorella equigenitalis]WDU54150.1 phosphatidate cytidylyltransferase [Taylorella equigenitalis]WDU57063.1 phosphatidate cytidylyltransferase [Taylorella equigenitalis]
MLFTRTITSAILLAIIYFVFTTGNQFFFAFFISLVSCIGLYEWLKMLYYSKKRKTKALIITLITATVFALLYCLIFKDNQIISALSHPKIFNLYPWGTGIFALLMTMQFFISFTWLFLVPIHLYQPKLDISNNGLFHQIFAIVAVLGGWISALTIYEFKGAWYFLSILITVFCADVFAFFGGKLIGGRKLNATISPAKTLSGFICGLVASVIWLVASYFIKGTFSNSLSSELNILVIAFIGVLLATLSVIGDLYESLLKRRAQIKDSGSLLPGHGGLLDRLDSIFPVLSFSMTIVFIFHLVI